jgi:methylaspartate ammonia-lyase
MDIDGYRCEIFFEVYGMIGTEMNLDLVLNLSYWFLFLGLEMTCSSTFR